MFFCIKLIFIFLIFFWVPFNWFFFFFFCKMNIFICCGLFLGFFLFFFGIIGFLFRQSSLLHLLLTIELMFFGINLIFLFLSSLVFLPYLQVIVLCLLTLTAAETAIFLALIFLYHKNFETTELVFLKNLFY
jgi:NADH-quinone oxidoreductase subunit K